MNGNSNISSISSPVVTSLGSQWGVNRTIELWREPGQEIGIGVVMGCIDVDVQEAGDVGPLSGIFIKHIVADSLAGRDGTINRGDRIVAVSTCVYYVLYLLDALSRLL